nr:ionotropic receptor 93a [Graphosoma rubrolineatum]
MVKFIFLQYLFISIFAYEYYYTPSDRKTTDNLLVLIDPNFLHPYYKGLNNNIRQMVSSIANKYLKGESLLITFTNKLNYRIKDDVTAIFSIINCEDTWDLFLEQQETSILFITITEPNCPRLPKEFGITIPLYEPGLEFSQILIDLRTEDFLEWETVNLIFDNSIDSKLIDNILEAQTKSIPLSKKSASVSLYKINGTVNKWIRKKEILRVMELIPRSGTFFNYLVVVQFELVPTIIEIAKSIGLMDPRNRWLFIRLKTDDSKANNVKNYIHLLEEGENVAFLYNVTNSKYPCKYSLYCHANELLDHLIVSFDKSMREEKLLSEQVSEEEWDLIRPSKSQRRNSIINFIKARQKEMSWCDNCTWWKIISSETWGTDFLENKELLESGDWTPRSGPVLVDQIFPNVAHGFRRKTIPLFTFHNPPWQIVEYDENGKPFQAKGVIFEVVDHLAKSLNFTYEIILMANTSLTTNQTNSNRFNESAGDLILGQSKEFLAWEQVVHLIQNKKVLLGAAAFTVTEKRKKSLNFTLTIRTENYAFLVARPKELSRALLFIQPFTPDTWQCIVAAVLIMTPLLNFVHRVSPFYEHYSQREKGGYMKMMNCFWYLYGALLQQGGGIMPEANSGRLVIGTWWLVVLVLVTTYSGNLVAFLTFPKMDKIISNVDQLMERRGEVTWGMPEDSTLHIILKSTDNDKLNDLSESAQLHPKVTQEIINQIRKGEHVYIDRKSILLYIMKQELQTTNQCSLSIGDEEFLAEQLAMVVSPSSPYLELINKQIYKMHQVGLIDKWMIDYLPTKDRCWSNTLSSESQTHTVNLDDMQGSFFLLFLGVALGFILIIGELLFKKWKKTQEKQVIHPFVA